MKRFVLKSPAAKFAVLPVLALLLSACHPAGNAVTDEDSEALSKKGYTRAPRITEVTQQGGKVVVIGQATPDGRVHIKYSGRSDATPTDSKGRFKFDVPPGPVGGLYDLEMDDLGRSLSAEGRLFVPTGEPNKAVTLHPGGASLSLGDDKNIMAVVDYDGAGGLAVAGKVEAGRTVNLVQGGVIIGRAQSDDTGRYHLMSQIAPPSAPPVQLDLAIEAGSDRAQHTITISLPTAADQITRLPDGWRVDWALPGGGVQTTLVF